MPTRREFLKGAGLTAALAVTPAPVRYLMPVEKIPREPHSVGLWYAGKETEGPGYKRLQLANVYQVEVDGRRYWDAADVTWLAGTFTADEIRLFDEKNQLIGSVPFGAGPASAINGNFTVQWAAEGVFSELR